MCKNGFLGEKIQKMTSFFRFCLELSQKLSKSSVLKIDQNGFLVVKTTIFCIFFDALCLELITKFTKKRALKKVPSRILAWGNCQNPHIFDYDKK